MTTPDSMTHPEMALREAPLLEKARQFAVMFLAFTGRDRGTDRLDKTLDDLTKMAADLDDSIRSARPPEGEAWRVIALRFVAALSDCGRNRASMLTINHAELQAIINDATALSTPALCIKRTKGERSPAKGA